MLRGRSGRLLTVAKFLSPIDDSNDEKPASEKDAGLLPDVNLSMEERAENVWFSKLIWPQPKVGTRCTKASNC